MREIDSCYKEKERAQEKNICAYINEQERKIPTNVYRYWKKK